jgi:opacity protein-like surface antigen
VKNIDETTTGVFARVARHSTNLKRCWRSLILMAGFVLFSLSPAVAGPRPDKDWKSVFGRVSAGTMVPQGDLDGILKGDFYVDGGVLYWPSDWSVGFEIDLGYVSSDFENSVIKAINDQLMPGEQITGGGVDFWSTSGNLVWGPDSRGKVGFYVTAGVGIDYIDAVLTETGLIYYPPVCDPWFWWCTPGGVGPGTVAAVRRDTWELGWNAGLGITFELESGSQVFFEARYKSSDTSPLSSEFMPVVLGVRW